MVVDRIGERLSLTIGLAIVTVGGLGAALSSSYVGLALSWLLAGVRAASTNSASGRLVVRWFPSQRRGTAMGIRQMALPLGIGPMRIVAVTALVTMVALGVLEETHLAVAIMIAATAVTVASNGLAFTAVAELGGPFWSGRAMGVHKTGRTWWPLWSRRWWERW